MGVPGTPTRLGPLRRNMKALVGGGHHPAARGGMSLFLSWMGDNLPQAFFGQDHEGGWGARRGLKGGKAWCILEETAGNRAGGMMPDNGPLAVIEPRGTPVTRKPA